MAEITSGDYGSRELGSPNPRYKEGDTSVDNQNAMIGHGLYTNPKKKGKKSSYSVLPESRKKTNEFSI